MGTSGFSLQVIDWMEKLHHRNSCKEFLTSGVDSNLLAHNILCVKLFWTFNEESQERLTMMSNHSLVLKNLRQSSIIPSFFYDTEWCYSWRDTGSDLWKVMILWSWRLTTCTTDNKVHLDSTIVSLYSLWAH